MGECVRRSSPFPFSPFQDRILKTFFLFFFLHIMFMFLLRVTVSLF